MKAKNISINFFVTLLIISFHIIFSNPLYAQNDYKVRPVGHFGGYPTCSAVIGDHLFLVQGTVLSVLKMNGSEFQKITSLILPNEPRECCATENYLYLFEFNWMLDATLLRIIDISDPHNPYLTSTLQLKENPGWFQGKFFVHNSHVFCALDNEFKIVDVSNPQSPEIVSTVSTSAKGIFVKDNYAYVGGENNFKIYDVTDKQNPDEIGACSIASAKDVYIQGNYAYVAVADYPDFGVQIIDIQNPQNPENSGFFETKKVDGSHTRYHNPNYVIAEGDHIYVGCYGSALLIIANISDPSNPQQTGRLYFDECASPNFQSFQLEYPYLYAATGATSIQFIGINISDAENPEIEMRFEEPWDAQAITTRNDTLFVSSFERLWIYDYSDTTNLTLLGSDTTWNKLTQTLVRGNYLYGLKENKFYILDVADANNIFEVGRYQSNFETIREVYIDENFAYLLCAGENQSAFEVINISDPNQSMNETGEHIIPGQGRDLSFLPDSLFAFVAYFVDSTDQGFQIIDVADPSNPVVLGSAQTTGNPISISVIDTFSILGSNTNETWYMETFNIFDPPNPVKMGSISGEDIPANSAFFSPSPTRGGDRIKSSPGSPPAYNSTNMTRTSEVNQISDALMLSVGSHFNKNLQRNPGTSYLAVVSIPNGSLHYYLMSPTGGIIEWLSLAICHSPASTVIAAMMHYLNVTFFSIDGWMDFEYKKVSGSWGIFIQRLYLPGLPVPIEIRIFPPDTTISEGDSLNYTAQGYDDDGNTVDVNVTWTATRGNIDENSGKYTATEPGDHTVSGSDSANGLSGSATVLVTPTRVETQQAIPNIFSLSQNYPNPFNPATSIDFSVKEKSLVKLQVFDIKGRLIETLINEEFLPGHYSANYNGNNISSGIYFYKIQMKNFFEIKKMVLLQ